MWGFTECLKVLYTYHGCCIHGQILSFLDVFFCIWCFICIFKNLKYLASSPFGFMFLSLDVYCAIGVWAVLRFVTWSDVLHFQRRFFMLHFFYLELTRTNFLGIAVHRQKWILAKSNRDREGNTCAFHRRYTDNYILSYPLSLGSYTFSYL